MVTGEETEWVRCPMKGTSHLPCATSARKTLPVQYPLLFILVEFEGADALFLSRCGMTPTDQGLDFDGRHEGRGVCPQ